MPENMTRERFQKAVGYFKQLVLLRADSNQKIMVDQLQPIVFLAFSDEQEMDKLFNAYVDWHGYTRSTAATGLFNSQNVDAIRQTNGQLADSLPFLFDWISDMDALIRTDLNNPREVFKERVNDKGEPLNQFTEEMLQASDKAVGVMRSNVGVDTQHVADSGDAQQAQHGNPPVQPPVQPSAPPSGMKSSPPNAPNP